MTILIAEDDPVSRCLLEATLVKSGYKVTVTTNGQEAWEALQREAPAIAILDWMMPVMSGGEFLEAQAKDPEISEIPVVVISAHVKADLFGVSLGIQTLLRKPFPLGELIGEVEKYAGRASQRSSSTSSV